MRLFLLASLILALGIAILAGMSVATFSVIHLSGGDACLNPDPKPVVGAKPALAPVASVGTPLASPVPSGLAVFVRGESRSKIVIRVTGEVESSKILAIARALEKVEKGRRHMLCSGLSINVSNDQDYFGHRGHWRIIGHYCDKEKICLLGEDIGESIVWHEIWHHYEDQVRLKGDKTHEEWQKVAGPVYRWNPDTSGEVKDGLVTHYARFNDQEDRAVFFQECMEYLHGLRTNSILAGHKGLKADRRYRQKLALMKEKYKAFTDDEYRTLKLLFE